MNSVQNEYWAFIFPDDMDAFRKRYGVDVIAVDFEEGTIAGFGPNDTDWRALPLDGSEGSVKVVKFGKDST